MARKDPISSPAAQPSTGLSVLLVEDNAAERWLYTEILRTRGHTVTACGDADQGWECYSSGEYPLILLDLQLPGGVDGLSLCRRIREREVGKRSIILVVTGRDEAETLEAVLEAGADDYIRKPVDVGLLNVRLAIAEREAERERLRHQTDVALEQTSLELQTLFRNLDDVFFSIDLVEQRLIQVSPAAKTLLGYTQEELLERPDLVSSLILPPEARTRLESQAIAEPGAKVVHPFSIRLPDGSERWVQANYKPVLEAGSIRRIDGVLTDVTERQRSQLELAARNREIATLARLTELALSAGSEDEAYREILEEASRSTGYPIVILEEWDSARDVLIVRHARGLRASVEEPLIFPAHETISGQVVHERKPVVETDLRGNRRHRATALLDLQLKTYISFPLLTGNDARGALTLGHTEALRPEPRLIRMGMSMASAIASHMDRLAAQEALRDREQSYRQLAGALQQANQELESFAYSVSHDLRAPLRTMQGFAHALLQNHGESLDSEAKDFANRIIRSGENAEQLISDLLAYSRLSFENLEMQDVDLAAVVTEVLDRLQGDIKTRDALIKVDKDLPHVQAHHLTLVQVTANLISNAIKFVPEGVRPEIRISVERLSNDAVSLEVLDNGVGVPEDKRERVFRVFERLSDQAHREGTGIGLAIVRRGMERLGGTASVDARPGGGSIFRVTIPNRRPSRI